MATPFPSSNFAVPPTLPPSFPLPPPFPAAFGGPIPGPSSSHMPPPYSSNGGANGIGNAGSATGSNQMRPPFAMLPFPQQSASSSQSAPMENGTNQYDASYSVVPQFKQEPQNRANGTANGM